MTGPSNQAQGKLYQSGEDYLEAILVLFKKHGEVHPIDLARYLNHAKPSITTAVAVLQEAGYLTTDDRHRIYLTTAGQSVAEEIYERHLFFRNFLTLIGVAPQIADEDACKLEHAISAESFKHLKAFIENQHFTFTNYKE